MRPRDDQRHNATTSERRAGSRGRRGRALDPIELTIGRSDEPRDRGMKRLGVHGHHVMQMQANGDVADDEPDEDEQGQRPDETDTAAARTTHVANGTERAGSGGGSP